MNSIFNNIFYTKYNWINTPKTKCRLFRSTKPKRDKEKEKKLKRISKNSKRKNRGKK